MARRLTLLLLLGLTLIGSVRVFAYEYERPVDFAPTEEDIGEGYVTPAAQQPMPRAGWWSVIDAFILLTTLSLASWLILARRNRKSLVVLIIGCLIYFGFYRKGCVCPIGAIQNVSVALTDGQYVIPVVVIVFFFLPLAFALAFGRVFCGGVCPLGAIQDLVMLKPTQVPRRLDKGLGLIKYAYLAAAVYLAVLPMADRDFIICRFDPFVGFFRMTGPGYMLIIGGVLLLLGIFIGRPYCRYLCPYGALLAIVSRFAWKPVTITPDKELDCGLCAEACPLGAIENMRAVKASCLACARCYNSCPRERVREREQTA
jgi:polyferredoxin